MVLSAPELSLLAVELLTALALAALWFGDRERTYTLWWSIAHLMLPVPALLTEATRNAASPLSALAIALYMTLAIQAISLLAGVASYRAPRWKLRLHHAVLAVVVLTALMSVPQLVFGRTWGRTTAIVAMMAALLASGAMMWRLGRFERVAALCLLSRGALEIGLLIELALGHYTSAWLNHFTSFNALTATGTALSLLIAAYQRSLGRLRLQYRILELTQELTARLQGVADEPTLARLGLEVLAGRLNWGLGTFLRVTDDPKWLRCVAQFGDVWAWELNCTLPVDEDGLLERTLHSRHVSHSADMPNDPQVREIYRRHPFVVEWPSMTAIPVTHGDEVLGVIMLRDRQPRELSRAEVLVLDSLGQVIGLSLANARNLRELAHRANHDALTGLGNRAALHDLLQLYGHQHRRCAVLLLDLDHFKQVNDALGHAIGDELLRELAARLRHYLADHSAQLFRLGGDEFVVLQTLDERPTADALTLADELAAVIAEPLQIGELSLRTPASIGVALAPEHGEPLELLRCADVAMYHAKNHGTGVSLYERAIDTHKLEHLSLLSAVNDALEKQQFELFYQPFVNLATGAVDGCEGLIRWRHPSLGLVGAAEFMPLIEATDLIRPLTRRVIDIATADTARWLKAGIDARVAINLSARNILDPELPAYLLDAIARHGIEPQRIQLEITETILIKDPASAGAVMQRLADAGFTLALDDFGTGYSSLAYLARFPIHTLKIDRSFVRDMLGHPQSRTIVESTISLARGLGLRVTAEGVEQTAEAELLRELGCDFAQGFLFSQPVQVSQLEALWGPPPCALVPGR